MKLISIPGVGPNIEKHLKRLGFHAVEDLAGRNAEEMYARDCVLEGLRAGSVPAVCVP